MYNCKYTRKDLDNYVIPAELLGISKEIIYPINGL
jgi:hypothetical protein